ncbi:DNA mismatch repair MSH1, mitochondrial [Olea europaea subsp. europaea]|uniref:DNA mismatch repair MSH1, mitochondrial n=1 Tax=Olea europaea subsp. europaea TaxID=158383 RepID=A0A8S0U9Z2_OLEEU|nr:DNA mismatch repair MSH1, mitochondrial [Olea europaea subsp. europaea]
MVIALQDRLSYNHMHARVDECKSVSCRIGEIISLEVRKRSEDELPYFNPARVFEDMESSWKGRVHRIHLEEEFAEVDEASEALFIAVKEDFVPIVSRIKTTTAPLGGPNGEILYAREHEVVWFKGKRFVHSFWAGTLGEQQIKQLKPALDSKGIMRPVRRQKKVVKLLTELSTELQTTINILVFASMLFVIAKA